MSLIKMYTTGYCPYCVRAKALLKSKGVEKIEEIRIDTDPAQREEKPDLFTPEREEMMRITGRRTVPQIFIGSTHVGGFDDLHALDQQGGLLPLLQAV